MINADERTPLLNGRPDASPSPTRDDKEVFNHPSRSDLIWIMISLFTAVFLCSLDITVVATLLAPIGSYFNKSNQASYLGTSFLLAGAAFTPLYGRLSDILGRKGAMFLAVGFKTIGTLMCGLAPSMTWLIIARAIAGKRNEFQQPASSSASSIIITDLVPLKRRGIYQGLSSICFGIGSGLGGPLGGYINDTVGWRWAFLLQIPALAISILIVLWKVNIILPASIQRLSLRERLARIDYLGSITLVTTISSLLLPFILNNTMDLPWGHPIMAAFWVTFVLSAVAFGLVETKWSPYPTVPMRLVTRRNPFFVSISNFLSSLQALSMLYNLPLYFVAVKQLSPSDAGLHLFPQSIAIAFGSVFVGWIMHRTGQYWWCIVGAASFSFISNAMIASWNENTSQLHLWFDIVPNGMANSALGTATLIAMIASVSREDSAVVTGISFTFRTVGQVLGVSLSGAVVQGVLVHELKSKITGPGSAAIIEQIRHSTSSIRYLEPVYRKAAIDSYTKALRVVFICQAVVSFLLLLSTLPIEEFPLP
ncbi:MFS general substrate transporter [Sistotremastrum niveocremeum HHB9708]|uniref:MFS general substrate transporter n=1 Tax=Sistotremastrum niveocremeum HHB9708 TaxID=1314777 RepID=A0A164TD41_9AGAM|nr:MFS general substrate transporter [Sistotremastrum niveocremeum HHB9708]